MPNSTLLMSSHSEETEPTVGDFRAAMMDSMVMRMACGIAGAIGDDLVDAKVKQQIRAASPSRAQETDNDR